jgi:hypothetical protein
MSSIQELTDTRKRFVEFLRHGSNGVVYDLGNNTCLKKIFNRKNINNDDQSYVINTMSKLPLRNFCKLLEVFQEDNKVTGYLMQKYQEEDISILYVAKDYLLDSYRNLYNDMLTLAENYICVDDFKASNVFITMNGIVAYDFDLYSKKTSKENARILNIARLNIMFNELLKVELLTKSHSDYNEEYLRQIDNLFNARTNIDSLEVQLYNFNRIIDYVRGLRGENRRNHQ